MCRWLAERGAQSLVIVSRTAGNSKKVQELRSELSHISLDVNIRAICCDVSDMAGLRRALDAYAHDGLPPIRGVIHGGMELQVCFFGGLYGVYGKAKC